MFDFAALATTSLFWKVAVDIISGVLSTITENLKVNSVKSLETIPPKREWIVSGKFCAETKLKLRKKATNTMKAIDFSIMI
jgi:hypothetical protein